MNERNPWKTLESKIVAKNPWFELRQDRVIRPDGKPGAYHTVLAPPAVGVVPCFQDGTILLVGQYRYSISRYSWEIPEGGSLKFHRRPSKGIRGERPVIRAEPEKPWDGTWRATKKNARNTPKDEPKVTSDRPDLLKDGYRIG